MIFIESSSFTKVIYNYLNEDEYKDLQMKLIEQPHLGKVMRGCGGIRKARWAQESKSRGKRGRVRVFYLYIEEKGHIFLLAIFDKIEKASPNREEIVKTKTLFHTIKSSLEEGISFYEGKKHLHTFHVPDPAPLYTPNQIKRIRDRLNVSQHVFALILNVSGKTIQSWEHGFRHPEKAACRLLQIIEKQPQTIFKI